MPLSSSFCLHSVCFFSVPFPALLSDFFDPDSAPSRSRRASFMSFSTICYIMIITTTYTPAFCLLLRCFFFSVFCYISGNQYHIWRTYCAQYGVFFACVALLSSPYRLLPDFFLYLRLLSDSRLLSEFCDSVADLFSPTACFFAP